MRHFIRFIKKFFGKYESGYEYWVRLDEIKIPEEFKSTRIGAKKWYHKMTYYLKTGTFESKIVLDKNFNLLDGYSSVKLALLMGVDRVPVYFVD